MAQLWSFLTVSLALFFGDEAWGCSVCGYASEESAGAFILTTGILTFLPLLFIGGVVLYLRRKLREKSEEY